MDKEKLQIKPKTSENHLVESNKVVNDLNTKFSNKCTVVTEEKENFDLKLNSSTGDKNKSFKENIQKPHSEGRPIMSRLRPRNTNNIVDTEDSDNDQEQVSQKCEKTVTEPNNERSLLKSSNKVEEEPIETVGSVGVNMLTYDVKIDPNVVDRYTDRPVQLLPGAVMPPPESPETKRKRIEKETMIVARQCRLHPANKKYNQGPVVNPPPISPGKLIGYTPGGQRHEVDLNIGRPTEFNSEYARMQYDDATRINVMRMFHDLETGMFLPKNLDPNLEREYFAEQDLAKADSKTHFQQFNDGQNIGPVDLDNACTKQMRLLETEKELLELNKFTEIRLTDFSGQVASKLTNALTLELTPLMFKKHPIIIETLEKLASQFIYLDVVQPARALLEKIKKLFEVPKGKTFKESFAIEVENLIKKTKNMNPLDVLGMTEEPDEEDLSDDNNGLEEKRKEGEMNVPQSAEECMDVGMDFGDWVPLSNNGEMYVDISPYGNENVVENSIQRYLNESPILDPYSDRNMVIGHEHDLSYNEDSNDEDSNDEDSFDEDSFHEVSDSDDDYAIAEDLDFESLITNLHEE